MKSIYLRNFTAMAVLVFFCLMLICLSFVGIGRMHLVRVLRSDMIASASEVSRIAAAVSQNDTLDSWLLGMNVSAIANSTETMIFIADADGCIVRCSDKPTVCRHIGMKLTDGVLELARSDTEFGLTNLDGVFREQRYVVSRAIYSEADGDCEGYVFVISSPGKIFGDWSAFLILASVVTVGILLVFLVVTLFYSKRMARPLDEIAAASRKFARGDFSVRVRQEYDSTDEMGALIDSFNKMADSLEAAEKRRSEFIANVSHELRTPMTTIAGFADGILDGTIPPEEERKYLTSIRDETRRLSRLVRDMLDASAARSHATDPSRRTVFDLNELLLQTLLSFEDRATKKNLDVDPQLPDNSIMVVADKDAITRVIYTLLDNAVKFANPGSCLTLRLYKDEEKAFVAVRDLGETIPPDDLPFLFDRFHKSDRSRSLDKEGM
ncbi:MAG: HAMP domain-containing histidine kinase, partial [Oscillospiraceae bacterium]|nr:HAMP domain-containing histidine kinase [Oscillospiraceae bacterium]